MSALVSSCVVVLISASPQNPTIASVAIRGASASNATELSALLTVHPGDRLDEERVEADVAAIFASRTVDDVRAAERVLGDGRLELSYQVLECPRLVEIGIEGLQPGDPAKLFDPLRDYLLDQLGKPTCGRDLRERLAKVEANYLRRGRPHARFHVELQEAAPGEVGARIVANPGEGNPVLGIALTGVDPARLEAVRAILATKVGDDCAQELIAQDLNAILSWYFNHGFVDAAVRDVSAGGEVAFEVREGPVYKFDKTIFCGWNADSESELRPGARDPRRRRHRASTV